MKLFVTGGYGFIGSNFIRLVLQTRPGTKVFNIDALTYAGNLENLSDDEKGNSSYDSVKGNITERDLVDVMMAGSDAVLNFAAESHVDRSLHGSEEFVRSNVLGTAVLLDAARRHKVPRFLQVSTDEVYGSLLLKEPEGNQGGWWMGKKYFTELDPPHPNNPYAATKAAADHLVMSYAHSFGLDIVITRSSNNYGPYQNPEKFMPLFITNALEGKECPLYGDGLNVRDWLHVEDNCRGILAALEKGRSGEVYNLGGENEQPNIDVARKIVKLAGRPESLIRLVSDRPGHDRRYALDSSKARRELGWEPQIPFQKGLESTVEWYRSNKGWAERARSRR